MGQPVKLSDALVLDARLAADENERSLAGQIEFWARLGRALDATLRPATVLKLKRRAAASPPLSECLDEVGTREGRERLKAVLDARPFPHFAPAPGRAGLLVKSDQDGTRTIGRFVRGTFTPQKGH